MKRSFKKTSKTKTAKRERSRLTPAQVALVRQSLIGGLLVSIVALFITGVWYGSRIDSLTIDTVTVVGGPTVAVVDVEAITERVLEGSHLRLVPHRFSPFTPLKEIEAQVKTIPRIKQVAVTKTDAKSLTVLFEEYIPAALWCGEAQSGCLFLDHTGYAFTTAPTLSGNALVRFVVPEVTPVTGQLVVVREVWEAAQAFIHELEDQLSLYVVEVVVEDEVDQTYRLARGGTLKVSNRLSVAESITNLQTILSNPDFAHLDEGEFHYIDLRFGDKIFVAEEEWQAVATTTDEVVATTTEVTTE